MTIRLGLISDIHAHAAPLREALSLFRRQHVDHVLCAGDIAGYGDELDETVSLLRQERCQCIQGNHEIWYLEKTTDPGSATCRYIRSLPRNLQFELAGKKIFMVHASPPDAYMGGIRLLDRQCDYDRAQVGYWTSELAGFAHDVLIVGHTHQVYAEHLGGTLVVNPGSATYNHSCAILSLPALSVEFHALSGKPLRKCWNWGDQFRN